MYSDLLNCINEFLSKEENCNSDAFLYYAVFNIVFFRTVSSKKYFIELLAEIVQYRNLTKLKIEKSTEMLYEFLKEHGYRDREYPLLLAVTVAVGAEAELVLSINEGKVKMTYDKLAATMNKLLFTMLKISEKEIREIIDRAMEIADSIDINDLLKHLETNIKWLQE